MDLYEVYYKGVLLGRLTIKGNDYFYVPNQSNVNLIESQGNILVFEVKATQTYDRPISFFELRIKNGIRFEDQTIGYQEDHYRMKELRC